MATKDFFELFALKCPPKIFSTFLIEDTLKKIAYYIYRLFFKKFIDFLLLFFIVLSQKCYYFLLIFFYPFLFSKKLLQSLKQINIQCENKKNAHTSRFNLLFSKISKPHYVGFFLPGRRYKILVKPSGSLDFCWNQYFEKIFPPMVKSSIFRKLRCVEGSFSLLSLSKKTT